MNGQAASYYQEDQVRPAPPEQYNQGQSYNNYNGNGYQQGYPPQQPPPPQQQYSSEKPEPPPSQSGWSYDEAFKIDKPKFNDIWAGLLVSIECRASLLVRILFSDQCANVAHRRFSRLCCRLRHLYQQVC